MAVAGHSVPLTKEGFETLKEELRKLRSEERPKVIQEIASARLHGDLSENAEYHAAREKQGFIEGRIADLEDKLGRAEIVDLAGQSIEQVRFGAYVTVEDDESGDSRTYRIVGDLEADIKVNKISVSSPIAKALMGKKVDDLVEVQAPKGAMAFTITAIEYR